MFPVSYANAGLLSFLGAILDTSESVTFAQEPAQDYVNSQNGGLLQAVVNVNPKLARGGGDIPPITDTGALTSNMGISGTALGDDEFSPSSDQLSIYVVRKGDSLSQIAKMFNVSVNTIIWANDIPRGGSIHEGETLVILPVSGVSHVIVKGDTVKSIAQKYKGDQKEILTFNGLEDGDTLVVGSTIIIPEGMIPPPVSTHSSYTKSRGTNSPSYGGYYLRPTNGIKSQGIHGYNGVDIAATTGTPVFASASGDVVVSDDYGWNGGYGNYIVISHDNGTQTLYAHLSKVIVGKGWRVVKGQVIGYVGNTGRSTGPHLHFEVRGAQNPFR